MDIATDLFEGRQIEGEVGIEIEMEGHGLITHDIGMWYSKEDGSLRGDEDHNSREYVLRKPIARDRVKPVLRDLKERLLDSGSEIVNSLRTGVHIHINIRHLTRLQLYNFIFTYYLFEDVLLEYAGEGREGNLFCLRARDAQGVLLFLDRAIKTSSLTELYTDEIRYAALNLKAIPTYGSLEFRSLSFAGDFKKIAIWTDLLLAIKDYAMGIKNPVSLISALSKQGGTSLAHEVFGNLIEHLPQEGMADKMLLSARLVQQLVYKNSWEDLSNYIIKTYLGD